MHGRAIDEQFPFHIPLHGRLDRVLDRLVIADAGEDDVGIGDGLFDAGDDGGFAGGEFGGEIGCPLLSAVVDYEWGSELGFFYEVFAHALVEVEVNGLVVWIERREGMVLGPCCLDLSMLIWGP